MPDGNTSQTIESVPSIHEVSPADWNACAGGGDPFVSHEFLSALEDSDSLGAVRGWMPRHLVARDETGRAWGCVPLYVKSHSYGEYVFDWSWADAYERAGGRYYPKLQAAVPFTPVPGRRLLLHSDAPLGGADLLAGAMVEVAERLGLSSVHVTFTAEDEWRRLGELGFLRRIGTQFHWHNRGYRTFEDFLGDLASRKRKAVRKERRAAIEQQDVTVRTLIGSDIEERHWRAFYRFYRNTHDRKWGHAYLNSRFFPLLGERLGERAVLFLAETPDGKAVAGALNVRGDQALYGRYWGCTKAFRFLHFELCYYRAIDFAIAHGMARVEAGAQGPHKIQRGYLPVPTYSAHWIADRGFRDAVDRYLASERSAVAAEMAALETQSPFRQAASGGD